MATSLGAFYEIVGLLKFSWCISAFQALSQSQLKECWYYKAIWETKGTWKVWGQTLSAKLLIGTARNRNLWLNLDYVLVEGFSGHFTKVCYAESNAPVPYLQRQSTASCLGAATVQCSQLPRASEDAKKNSSLSTVIQDLVRYFSFSPFSCLVLIDTPGNLILIPFLLSPPCPVTIM